MTIRVAMIGAGLGGLVCAESLTRSGRHVQVFEKSRGVGGRMATRRVDVNGAHASFDHGAQYFTARDEAFSSTLERWAKLGLCAPWTGRIAAYAHGVVATGGADPRQGSLDAGGGRVESVEDSPVDRWVATPTMTAIAKHLTQSLPPVIHSRVERVELDEKSRLWSVATKDEVYHGFDVLLSNAPAPQTVELLRETPIAAACRGAKIAPCWALMAGFDRPLPAAFDGLFINEHPVLAWAARNNSKPGRPDIESWIVHANSDWSTQHEWEDPQAVTSTLWQEFTDVVERATKAPAPAPTHLGAHRWRFALPTEPLKDRCLWNAQWRLGACGDWCGGPRVEGAFLSGQALSAAVQSG